LLDSLLQEVSDLIGNDFPLTLRQDGV